MAFLQPVTPLIFILYLLSIFSYLPWYHLIKSYSDIQLYRPSCLRSNSIYLHFHKMLDHEPTSIMSNHLSLSFLIMVSLPMKS